MREKEGETLRETPPALSLVLQLVPRQFLFHPQEGWAAPWSLGPFSFLLGPHLPPSILWWNCFLCNRLILIL